MPRKRKGPKREPSEGDPPMATTSNQNGSLSTGIATATTPLPAGSSMTAFAHRSSTIDSPAAQSLDQEHGPNQNKRAKHLAEAEEDRLGKLVGLDRWVESIGYGRGAAVCICGEVVQAKPSSNTPASDTSFLLELSCFHPAQPASRSTLSVTFQGELAHKVAEPLLLLHRLGPPAVVYLSGFAADLLPVQQGVPRATFQHQMAVLKMSPQPPSNDPAAPTSAIWIEQLATLPLFSSSSAAAFNAPARTVSAPTIVNAHPASPNPPRHPATTTSNRVDPSPPSQLSDWFSTPVPSSNAQARPVAATTTSAMSALPPPPPQPRQANDASSSLPTSRPVASMVKTEMQGGSSSSPRPARASSGQNSAVPPPPRRNAPHVKPRKMGNCLYTPMSMVRDGERARIIGVVMSAGDPRRSSSGTRDLSIKITIADASCLSGTGYAKELARSMTVMLFAQQNERIPQTVKPGHVVAIRGVQIQMFGGKPQAVGKSAASWSWATYDPVSGDVRASSNFPLASQTPPECSAEEMEHFRDMANWFSELQGVDANIMTRSSRPTLKLQEIGENTFFDTVVEVLKVYTHTLAPDLYVSDYTNHALFYRGNDKYLRLESDIPYPDDTDGWGHVFQISLWDSHATIAEGLQTGDIIRIQNVRPKLNPRGLLTGGLGSSTDSGIKIRTLKPTDEARIDLEKRRARFLETLFTAEEEAFADRVERDLQQASQLPSVPQPNPTEIASEQQQQPLPSRHEQPAQHSILVTVPAAAAIPSHQTEPITGRQTAASTNIADAIPSATRTQSHPTERVATSVVASPLSSTQPPFPTPAQRQMRTIQEVTPSKPGDSGAVLSPSSQSNRDACDLSLVETPDIKPHALMGPPGGVVEEQRPLIRCNAPASIPLTALAELCTTSLCPGMYKVKARIISTNPSKVEQWGRMECKACKKMVPHDQRFCVRCGDEDGESLSYCLRFAIMLEEVDAEFVARKQQQQNMKSQSSDTVETKKVTIPLLFHGRTAEVLLPCIDAKAILNGERSSIKTLRRFHNRLLHPQEYGTDREQVLAVHSFWSEEAGRKVRRFAALKELNCLQNPRDLL